MGLGGRPPSGPFDDVLWVRVEKKLKEELKRKSSEHEISKLVRALLSEWMREHGCERMNTEVNAVTLLRLLDRYVNKKFNVPRLTYALPTVVYDSKLTHPLKDMLPKGLSTLLFKE